MSMLEVLRDEYSAPWFDAASAGTLLLRTCAACGHVSEPTARRCAACYSADVSWTEAAGDGRLVTWAVPHVKDETGAMVPSYAVAIVETVEGPWLHVRLSGDHAAARADMPVTIDFERAGDGEPLPIVRL